MRNFLVVLALTLSFLNLVPVSLSAAQEEVMEHPVSKPLPNSMLLERSSKKEDHSVTNFRIRVNNVPQSVEKGGQYWRLSYRIVDANGEIDKSVSQSEILLNYKAATEDKGGTVYNMGSNYAVFSVPRRDGGTSWAKVNVSPGSYRLEIVDEKPMEKRLTFGVDEMKTALDGEGRIAVYGINFDVGSAVLQVGAESVIINIVKLLKMYPELKIELQGHTDNTGPADLNQTLSQQRAETVVRFMRLFGVEESRLIAKGYGPSRPVESNDTEEGRAANRRVELVKLG